jgi:hypothetical protein
MLALSPLAAMDAKALDVAAGLRSAAFLMPW